MNSDNYYNEGIVKWEMDVVQHMRAYVWGRQRMPCHAWNVFLLAGELSISIQRYPTKDNIFCFPTLPLISGQQDR